MKPYPFIPLDYERPQETQQLEASRAFLERLGRRRSVRQFSTEPVPFELVANAVAAAGTAPSGAHQQPWTFVVVSNPELKRSAAARGARNTRPHARIARWPRNREHKTTTDAPQCGRFEQVYESLRTG